MPNDKGLSRLPNRKKVNIFLQNISQDYYLNLKSLQVANECDGFLSEPVQIYNKIVGGIRIFGNYASNVTKIYI